MDDHKITSERGSAFTIGGMIAAYNDQTKEAYFYLEVERVEKKHIEEYMIRMGAGSVDVTPVSALEWEADSRRAIRSVIEYGERNGFVAVQYGVLSADTRGDGDASTGGAGGIETESEEEEDVPRPGSEEGGGNKRKRAASPDGGGLNMVSLDVMMDKLTATVSSAVASAVNSSGSALSSAVASANSDLSKERDNARNALLNADTQLQEIRAEMRHKDAQHAADLVKKEHDAQMKSKDDAHAAEMAGLRGELYAEYEEQRLKALEEVRKKLEEGFQGEKFKLEKNLQDKVVYFLLSA